MAANISATTKSPEKRYINFLIRTPPSYLSSILSMKHHNWCPKVVRLKLTHRTVKARHIRISDAFSHPLNRRLMMIIAIIAMIERAQILSFLRQIGDTIGALGLSTGAYFKIKAKPIKMDTKDIRSI